MSVRELAHRWSELLLMDVPVGMNPVSAVRESGTLLRDPASEAAVRAAEMRLGSQLPPSYREFLLASDSAYGDLYGVSFVSPNAPQEGWTQGTCTIPGLGFLPCEQLQWWAEKKPDLVDIYLLGDEHDEPLRARGEPWPWDPFARGLSIGVDHCPGDTCLVPFPDMQEWQVWRIHKESADGFLSFRDMLKAMIAEREPITSRAELAQVLSQADPRDFSTAARLAWTTAHDVVQDLTTLLRGGKWGFHAAQSLGRMATVEAVEALVSVDTPASSQGLLLAATPRARDVLDQRACYSELARLGDPRAPGAAARYLSAQPESAEEHTLEEAMHVLVSSGDIRWSGPLLAYLDAKPFTAITAAYCLGKLGHPAGILRLEALAQGVTSLRERHNPRWSGSPVRLTRRSRPL